MVTELGLLYVKPDHRAAFERDMPVAAADIIGAAEGFISYTAHGWGVEEPDTFMFTVQWETVEHHTVTFWNSPGLQAWIDLMDDHMAAPGSFRHFIG